MRTHTFIIISVVATGCGGIGPGLADFSVSLPNGYYIHRTSAHQIMVAPQAWSPSTPLIPTKVVELDHDSVWVIAKQQHLRRRMLNPNDKYEEPDPGAFSYWILNTKTPKVWGPFTEKEFSAKRAELNCNPNLRLHDVYDYAP